jgi:hypothetical protein
VRGVVSQTLDPVQHSLKNALDEGDMTLQFGTIGYRRRARPLSKGWEQ